jgi:hypothetical protein
MKTGMGMPCEGQELLSQFTTISQLQGIFLAIACLRVFINSLFEFLRICRKGKKICGRIFKDWVKTYSPSKSSDYQNNATQLSRNPFENPSSKS